MLSIGNLRKMSSTANSLVNKTNEIVKLGGVSTHVLKYGSLPPDDENKNSKKFLFLVIPGNPGVMEFYEVFMEKLYNMSDRQVPVWGISHTGHVSIPPEKNEIPTDFENSSYSLPSQISNKAEFINKFIPSDVKLLLIGHSIGCYMILKLLDQILNHQVYRCFMLFPTIEKMAISPNGKFVTPTLKYFRGLGMWFVHGISYMPTKLRAQMIKRHFNDPNFNDIPECIYSATLGFVNPYCVYNSLNLAHMEMRDVVNCDENIVSKHMNKLSFYHGQHDKWCPREYYYAMIERFPDCDIRLCNRGYEHAFVIKASPQMADIVWKWFKDIHVQDSS